MNRLQHTAVLLLALGLPCAARAQLNPSTDAVADAEQVESAPEHEFILTVRADLVAERFSTLDSTATDLLRTKARWPGGGWKLRSLYSALDAPHETEADTTVHLEHLRHWMQQRPTSLTARIALATSLTRWAWVARGNGFAPRVAPDAWKLFDERIQEAATVLQGSRNMQTEDPQWYCEEMLVGRAQHWDDHRERDIYERGVQFEPDYQYLYLARVEYLLPKWYGKPDDATSFAKQAVDHVGGDMGDYVYFKIASEIISRHNGQLAPFVAQLDWSRIQRGYQALQAQFQTNRRERNEFALMAYEFKDQSAAQTQFALIGNNWSHSVWGDRNYFEKIRDRVTGHQNWP